MATFKAKLKTKPNKQQQNEKVEWSKKDKKLYFFLYFFHEERERKLHCVLAPTVNVCVRVALVCVFV